MEIAKLLEQYLARRKYPTRVHWVTMSTREWIPPNNVSVRPAAPQQQLHGVKDITASHTGLTLMSKRV